MSPLVEEFLAQKRIAVVGVSRTKKDAANGIFVKLRDEGYQVFAVNPNATVVEGAPCYARVSDIPGGVDAVVIVTRPEATEEVVRDCHRVGVTRVWMHNNTFLPGSTSEAAVAFCREHDMKVIPAGCPMMHLSPDVGHACMRWVLQVSGRLPPEVTTHA
ncbi:MAG: CoA-binding protein [Myxococcota bacterium]